MSPTPPRKILLLSSYQQLCSNSVLNLKKLNIFPFKRLRKIYLARILMGMRRCLYAQRSFSGCPDDISQNSR